MIPTQSEIHIPKLFNCVTIPQSLPEPDAGPVGFNVFASESHKVRVFPTQFKDRQPLTIQLHQKRTILRDSDATQIPPASDYPVASEIHNVCVLTTQVADDTEGG